MVIKKKIDNEIKKRKFIAQGGSSPIEKQKWTTLCVRISEELLSDVEICKKSRTGLTRNAWILEAIQEKIRRDGTNE